MKPNYYAILSRAVEEGVTFGHRRAYKHTDTPAPEVIESEIIHAVMSEISTVFSFEDGS